LFLLEW